MIGDPEILEPQFESRLRHLRQRAFPVARRGVIVKGSLEILQGDQPGQRSLGAGFDFTGVFPKLRFHIVHPEKGIEFAFSLKHRRGIFFLASFLGSEPVFVEGVSLVDGPPRIATLCSLLPVK